MLCELGERCQPRVYRWFVSPTWSNCFYSVPRNVIGSEWEADNFGQTAGEGMMVVMKGSVMWEEQSKPKVSLSLHITQLCVARQLAGQSEHRRKYVSLSLFLCVLPASLTTILSIRDMSGANTSFRQRRCGGAGEKEPRDIFGPSKAKLQIAGSTVSYRP